MLSRLKFNVQNLKLKIQCSWFNAYLTILNFEFQIWNLLVIIGSKLVFLSGIVDYIKKGLSGLQHFLVSYTPAEDLRNKTSLSPRFAGIGRISGKFPTDPNAPTY